MNRIEKVIILPLTDNDGHSLALQHNSFKLKLLGIASGYSCQTQGGEWRDGDTVYTDASVRYTVLCTTRQASKIDALIPALCRDCRQECILTTSHLVNVQFVSAQIVAPERVVA